jgi:hypothetical protein
MVVNSAGNEGGSFWQYVGAPADGDSVFSIGAVDASGFYASFSSTGPTPDGRIKPDVTAQGQGTTVVSGWGFIVQGSGTSFSSPVTAGALACLMQSSPALSAEQIRVAVRTTASMASTPDSLYGWGIPNLMNARTYLSAVENNPIPMDQFSLFPMPFSSAPVLKGNLKTAASVTIEILSVTGQVISSQVCSFQPSGTITLADFNIFPAGIYFLRISTGNVQQVIRAVKL